MLGSVKARSVGADGISLLALKVLVYSQLEGGIKDLTGVAIRTINVLRLPLQEIHPCILEWRNPEEIKRFRNSVSFGMIANAAPFDSLLKRKVRLRGVNRYRELNQMGWNAIRTVYTGLRLDLSSIELHRSSIDRIVIDRNDAAHYGVLPGMSRSSMELELRANAAVVEQVLTDYSLQLLPYFSRRLHRR